MKNNSYGLISALNESFENDIKEKRTKALKESQRLKEADSIEVDKYGSKSIRDGKTGHLKKITVSKKAQDKMADDYNKKLDKKYGIYVTYGEDGVYSSKLVDVVNSEEQAQDRVAELQAETGCGASYEELNESTKLNETGEWDDSDEDMIAWKEDLRGQAEELANQIDGEVKVVKGFDAYQGPFAVVHSPKHGDVILWYDQEDDTGRSFNCKIAHVGWISGGITNIAELLNQDTIPEDQIINESTNLNEDNSIDDAYNRLIKGEDVYFRDESGIPLLGHYADNYPNPEDYDEGYTTGWNRGEDKAFDEKQDKKYNEAKAAAEEGEVWEFVEVFEDDLTKMNSIFAYAYGLDELKDVIRTLRPVKVNKSLEESTKLNESVFEINYAPDNADLSSKKSIIQSVKKWLGPLADSVDVYVKEVNGPSAGWPVVRLSGNKEEIAKFLNQNYNSGVDSMQDTLDLYLIKESASLKEVAIQGLDGYSEEEIKNIAKNYIETALTDADVDMNNFSIVDMNIYGSRGRGTARDDSDLDIVFEYTGDEREDDLFNILNDDEPLMIEDIKVDLNPINAQRSGDMKSFMDRSNKYDEEKLKEAQKLEEKLNFYELRAFSKKALDAKSDEDLKNLANEIKPYSEPTYTRCMEIINGDGSTQYKAGQISDMLYQLNEAASLKEFNNAFNFEAFANYIKKEISKIYPSAKFNIKYDNGKYLEVYLSNNHASRFIIEAYININDDGSLDDGAIEVTYPDPSHYSSEDLDTICNWTGNSNTGHFNIDEVDKALEMISFICNNYKMTDVDNLGEAAKFKDKVKAVKKTLLKDKRKTNKSAQKSAENIVGAMVKEEETVLVNAINVDPDYVITDVTELEDVNLGDIQSPDIDAMLSMIQESIKEKYGPDSINVHIHSAGLLENGSFVLVDITTPEILKEFAKIKSKDTAIGKSLILENKPNHLYEFRVNNTSGSTAYIKRTKEPAKVIMEWLETEYLSEAKKAKEEEELIHKRIKLEDTINQFLSTNAELQLAIETLKMYIEVVGKDEESKEAIRSMIEKIAVEFPVGITTTDDSLKFDSRDDVIEILFGKEWIIKEPKETKASVSGTKVIKESSLPNISKFIYDLDKDKGNAWSAEHYTENGNGDKIIIVSKNGKSDNTAEDIKKEVENKYKNLRGEVTENGNHVWFYLKESAKLNESYQQFNIGEIDVVYNPETQEVMYSVGVDDKHDKKINLTKIPSVETPYNTETIIKNYIEKQYGPIPEIEDDDVENSDENLPLPQEEPTQDNMEDETPITEEDDTENEISQDAGLEQSTPEEDEALEDSKPETGSAKFQKIKPNSGVSVEELRTSELDGTVQADSQFIVVEEINLDDAEFNTFSNDVSKPQDFFTGVTPLDRRNYSFNVVKITNENSSYVILADPVGYNYRTLHCNTR